MKSGLFLALIAIACSASSLAAGKSPVEVNVAKGGSIALRVTAPASLMDVLVALCDATHANCEGLTNARSVTVAPLELNGGWNEVLSRLLAGTQLDYVASPASSEQQSGTLLVQAASTVPENAAGVAGNDSHIAASEEPAYTATAPANESASASDDHGQPSEEISASSMSNGQSLASSDAVSSTGTSGSPLTSSVPTAGGNGETASGFPFPDSHGNIIPVRNEPAQYLPFPDSHGNLIPADPNAPTSSPFPTEAIRDANSRNPPN